MLDQLPEDVQNCLYQEFLYKKFLDDFKYIFKFQKKKVSGNLNAKNQIDSFYTWDDKIYRGFMVSVLQRMEPRFIPKNTALYHELEEI